MLFDRISSNGAIYTIAAARIGDERALVIDAEPPAPWRRLVCLDKESVMSSLFAKDASCQEHAQGKELEGALCPTWATFARLLGSSGFPGPSPSFTHR